MKRERNLVKLLFLNRDRCKARLERGKEVRILIVRCLDVIRYKAEVDQDNQATKDPQTKIHIQNFYKNIILSQLKKDWLT